MTSDAKIGLLLGLIFIFIIAFVINGLPNLHKDKNDNELTIGLVGSQNAPPGLAAGQRNARREVIGSLEPVREPQVSPAPDKDIRFETPLPATSSMPEKDIAAAPVVLELPPVVVSNKSRPETTQPAPPASPQTYTVAEGDSLASIAKKFYGDSEGNRLANIERIFEANHSRLKSPDQIYVGQKLTIPVLGDTRSKLERVFSGAAFKKVESIGRPVKQSHQHVVREGDSLWQIAAEQLGDGSRYNEIAELNADIINDEDALIVGTRLKLPVQ